MPFSLGDIRAKADWYARRTVLAAVAGALAMVGAGFLVAAGWLILAEEFSALVANLALALAFLGAGAIVLIIRSRKKDPVATPQASYRTEARPAPEYRVPPHYAALIDAVVIGVSIYQRLRNQRR